ncbi:MAG: Ig-like domain-containing protein, partial [Planctomycetota bacterium]
MSRSLLCILSVLLLCACERSDQGDGDDPVPVNRAPTAEDIAVRGEQGMSVSIELQGSDPDGDVLSYEITEPPAVGSLEQDDGATYTYTAPSGWHGVDRFTYTVSDGESSSAPATVSVTVRYEGESDPQLISAAQARPAAEVYRDVVEELALSADGRVLLFSSRASGLVAGDSGNWRDIFRYVRSSQHLERVSVASDGSQGQGDSSMPAVSADGRYCAFVAGADNLVPGDQAGFADVFLHDALSGGTERISVASNGDEALGSSASPSLSSDGRYVVFASRADNLTADDNNGHWDVFVRDRESGVVRLLSRAGGSSGTGDSTDPMISADGGHVVFVSTADDLVPGDLNGVADIFRVAIDGSDLRRISAGADAASSQPSISSDGDQIAFQSDASLVEDSSGIFVHQVSTGSTVLVSRDAFGPSPGYLSDPMLSGDGSAVVFVAADSLDPLDTNSRLDVYRHELASGSTAVISVASDGASGDGDSRAPQISADGQLVVCRTDSSDLLPADAGLDDVLIRAVASGTTDGVRLPNPGTGADGPSEAPDIRADGRLVVFASAASNLVADDSNRQWDVFAFEVSTGIMQRLSQTADGRQSGSAAGTPALAGNARFVAFSTRDPGLTGQEGGASSLQILLHDRANGELSLASPGIVGGPCGGHCFAPAISADGRYVVFASDAADLVADDGNGVRDIFQFDRVDGVVQRLSLAATGAEADAACHDPAISADGSVVVFAADAGNLVAGDGNGLRDVFRWTRASGLMERVSVPNAGGEAGGASGQPVLSTDGSVIAFASDADDLVAGDGNAWRDIFVLADGNLTRISSADGGQETADCDAPVLSADGRYCAFTTAAPLLAEDGNGLRDVYVYDRQTGVLFRASTAAAGGDSAGSSWQPALSADGAAIVFTTTADDIAGRISGQA